MTENTERSARETALDWAARIQASDFDDWDGHAAWLEANPTHASLYRAAAMALEDGLSHYDASERIRGAMPANDDEPRPARSSLRRVGWVAGVFAVAASGALLLIPSSGPPVRDRYVRTALGEMRTLKLADGSTVTLNGGTSLRVDGTDSRRVSLGEGEIFVNIIHDADHPFVLKSGGHIFKDLGTSFNLRRDGGHVSLGVTEGVVAYDPASADIRVHAGATLEVENGLVRAGHVEQSSIGSWQSKRLIYADETLSRISIDLTRALGEQVVISGRVADRRFSGVIDIDAPASEIVNRFARLNQIPAKRTGKRWMIGP